MEFKISKIIVLVIAVFFVTTEVSAQGGYPSFEDWGRRESKKALPRLRELSPNEIFDKGISFKSKGDIKNAIKMFSQASEKGHIKAMHELGMIYFKGEGTPNDDVKAFSLLQKAAQKGELESERIVASMYLLGRGVEQNSVKANEWFSKAALHGDLNSMAYIGKFSFENREYNKALPLLEKAANNGDAESQYMLGSLYENGYGVECDYKKAYELYSLSSNQGLSKAQNGLACLLRDGKGCKENIDKAIEWFELAASQNFDIAMINLGDLYRIGDKVEQNYPRAKAWYFKSKSETPSVLFSIGLMEELGSPIFKKDILEAIALYQIAAEKGHIEAMYRRAVILESEDYQSIYNKDFSLEAYKWYKQAAINGHPKAQFVLAKSYENGNYSQLKDINMAFEWYEKSIQNGCDDALIPLVELSDALDKEIDLKWYQKAAELGNPAAQYKLGKIYINPDYALKYYYYDDEEYYMDWFQIGMQFINKAKDQNYIKALRFLAYEHCTGDWTKHYSLKSNAWKPDFEKAILYFEKAASLGDVESCNMLSWIYRLGGTPDYEDYIQKDLNKSFKFCLRGAELGDMKCQYEVAGMYHYGEGIKKNRKEASYWINQAIPNLIEASENGDEHSSYQLYCIYKYGIGIEVNKNLANRYYSKYKEQHLDFDEIRQLMNDKYKDMQK